jgi:hypothetical protein
MNGRRLAVEVFGRYGAAALLVAYALVGIPAAPGLRPTGFGYTRTVEQLNHPLFFLTLLARPIRSYLCKVR